jgi:putative nucleotidyltransferase with HDIG domain
LTNDTIVNYLPCAPDWVLDWDGITAAYPWIRKLIGCTQDPVHHAEGDVYHHTFLVTRELVTSAEFRRANADDQLVVFACALLHDVCKPETWAIDAEGRITNHHHSRIGANEARQILWRMGLSFSVREKVCAIIAVHQTPFWLIERPGWQATYVLAATSLQVENRLLAMMAEADARGRICTDRQRIIDNVELFRDMARDENCYDRPFLFYNDHARMRYFQNPEIRDPRAELYDTTDPDFTVTVLSGLPGAGKSTWIAAAVKPGGELEGQTVVSMDLLRAEMKVKPDDDQGTVRQAALKRARENLASRRSFVWDALNLDWQRRQPIASLCMDYGARVRYAYVEAPEATVLAQNRSRAARLPEPVILKMLRRWEPPTLTECHELTLSIASPAPLRGMARPIAHR